MSALRGGQMTAAQVATDAFGNALGNSIVDRLSRPAITVAPTSEAAVVLADQLKSQLNFHLKMRRRLLKFLPRTTTGSALMTPSIWVLLRSPNQLGNQNQKRSKVRTTSRHRRGSSWQKGLVEQLLARYRPKGASIHPSNTNSSKIL